MKSRWYGALFSSSYNLIAKAVLGQCFPAGQPLLKETMGWFCSLCHAPLVDIARHDCDRLRAVKAANASRPFSTRPKLLSDFNGHTRPLPNTSTSPHIYPPYLRKYNAALRNWGNDIGDRIGSSKWSAFSKVFTVEDIANLSPQRHLELIDNIWEEIVEFHEYDTPINAMADPARGNHLSSRSQPNKTMFRSGYAFRCDSRGPGSVLRDGFKPLYDFNCPDEIQETILHRRASGQRAPKAAGFWRGNRDIASESSICVARELRASGKFPTPSARGPHYMYALKFRTDKRGFDTEARQQVTGGRWLGGEKCFPEITPREIIGHIAITKQGSDNGTDAFGSFSYDIAGPWLYTRHATSDDKLYLTQELHTLTGGQQPHRITVRRAEDFVAT